MAMGTTLSGAAQSNLKKIIGLIIFEEFRKPSYAGRQDKLYMYI
jgi:hypothetical protein